MATEAENTELIESLTSIDAHLQGKKLDTVEEIVLKKRKTLEQIREKREQARKTEKPKKEKAAVFKRAENFVTEFIRVKSDEKRLRRSAYKVREDTRSGKIGEKVAPGPKDNAEGKIVLVMRIKPMKDSAYKTKKYLHEMRLNQVNSAVFLRLTKANLTRLRLVSPYVVYGVPTLKTIRELVYKRGFAVVDKERLPITDNAMIEKQLGQHGIVCLEDIVHEVSTGGKNFNVASTFLHPFKLSNPHKGHTRASTRLAGQMKGGDLGDEINKLVLKMN